MPATRKTTAKPTTTIRLPAELITQIDAAKDPDASREKFVRRLIGEALAARKGKR